MTTLAIIGAMGIAIIALVVIAALFAVYGRGPDE